MNKVIVISCTHYDLVRQQVCTSSEAATETMIGWLRDIAFGIKLSYSYTQTIESRMRFLCYNGSEVNQSFSIDEFVIYYREFQID